MEGLENLSITINEVTKEYRRNTGIMKVTTKFESGILNILVGDNGSGKSTLFKCIMGLCNYNGEIIKRKHRIGYAPEEYVMPLHLTVLDFLRSIGRIKGINSDDLDQNVLDYLAFFELLDYKNKTISKLSNGMRQKVNLMQAFVHEPKIIILDEPLAALDKESIPKVVKLIKEKAKTSLVVVSTHHLNYFRTNKKKLYYFKDGMLLDA
ncbi:MAG: ABC transporter ATP-binding protein [Tenericutes bacterium]|nr:ABC transporter ATP-binding protein [Mycoplasmatota bacterium]